MNRARRHSISTPSMTHTASAALVAMIVVALLLVTACGSDDGAPTLGNPSQTGHELVDAYMSMLADADVAGLDDFLSDAFIRQGAEGRFATKDEYLSDLPQLSTFTISDVTAKQDGDALVVRWLFAAEEVIDGKALQTTPAPRLATFVWDDGEWKLLSHANFNVPAE